MEQCRILCIDDDRDFLTGVRMQLKGTFYITMANSIDEGLGVLQSQPIDLVLLDIDLNGESGIAGIGRIKSAHPYVDICMLSGQREPRTVVKAIRAGAVDYMTKPFELDDLMAVVERTLSTRRVREHYAALVETQNTDGSRKDIVHRSEPIRRLLTQADQLRGHKANVLVVGETGTGKELFARYVHRLEGDARRPFIAVNCAAIPEHLLEAELFGAEAGSYTGAVKRRIGKFELADGGDIFLDEIGSLKLDLQAKILRVLQEKEFSRLGGNDVIDADFRVISATNEPLEEKVSRGTFRMDLYHRLRVIQFSMPPLRERVEDIPALADHFLAKYARDGGGKAFSPGAMSRLMAYHWPGNVRELANVVQSLTILAPGDVIDENAFPSWVMNGCRSDDKGASIHLPTTDKNVSALKDYVSRAEQHYISYALRAYSGDKSKAARAMGLGRTTLYAKMKDLGMM